MELTKTHKFMLEELMRTQFHFKKRNTGWPEEIDIKV